MHSRALLVVLAGLLLLSSLPANAARQTKEQIENNFLYGWSKSSTIVFYGTIAAVYYDDDPKERAATVEILIRVDSTQRGVPGNSMFKVRIEDEIQTYRCKGDTNHIGETGIWFVHRVRQIDGEAPRAHLIRYIDQSEMEEDPAYLSELMKYVIQDTVDQTIRPNILNILTGNSNEREKATIKMLLEYDDGGALQNIEFVERSGNLLFNDHVFDTILQIHRRIRIPGQVRKTEIVIDREVI